MKILTSDQIRAADNFAIEMEPIASIDLMERAGEKCCEYFPAKGKWSHLVVICGKGNNGGDGLVIARLQKDNFKSVRVLLLESSSNSSEDFKINLKKLQDENVKIEIVKKANDIFLHEEELVIDAILGTGVNRPVEGFLSECILAINQQASFIISIDLPSGMSSSSLTEGAMIKANQTLTIGAPKLALFVKENSDFIGEWKLVSIYNDTRFLDELERAPIAIDKALASKLIKPRNSFSHKGTFGKALLIVGGEGKYGAAILSTKACLRSGVGLLTVQVPSNAISLIHSSAPEALVVPDLDAKKITVINEVEMFDSIGIGPAIGTANETIDALIELFNKYNQPFVIDADALNIISEHPDLLTNLPENSILTPHPKEFERLFGPSRNSFERLEKQITHSVQHGIIIVCKSHYTTITAPDGSVYVNLSGNSGLAKGGSGDVLTGVLTSLLSQGYEPIQAAILGVFVHGHSADMLSKTMHESGILPSDIIEQLPFAFKELTV